MIPEEEYLAVVDAACDALDGIQEYGIRRGDADGLLVMHGLAMYARDTARSAALLLREDRTLSASALARIVLEHAVFAQWLKVDPEGRGNLFLQQGDVERLRWFDVVLAADLGLTDPVHAARKQEGRKPKNVAPEFEMPRKLFGDTEQGRQFYFTYRNLSRFVHPSVATFGRYTAETRQSGDVNLLTTLQIDQDSEAAAFYLASAIVLCAAPYLEVLGEDQAGVPLLIAAHTAHVPTSLN